MADKWVEVRLGGYLRQFGKSYKFFVSSQAEAIRALTMQVPGIKDALETAHQKGFEFAIFNGTRNIKDPEELKLGVKDVLRIIPVAQGSKKQGLLQTIIGVIIVAAAIITQQYEFVPLGLGIAFGGISQMLAPSPKGLSEKDNDDTRSYTFGSPVNTSAQGKPVPLFYGEREVGGPIISAGMAAEDQM